jgi:hypothetical protein
MRSSWMMFMKEHCKAIANNLVSRNCRFEYSLLNISGQIWPERKSSLTKQPAELLT